MNKNNLMIRGLKSLKDAAKYEWANRTLTEKAWKAYQKTGKMPKGLQGWNPLKAFTPKMLATGRTPGARVGGDLGTALMIGAAIGKAMEENLPVSDFKSGRGEGRKAFNNKKKKEE